MDTKERKVNDSPEAEFHFPFGSFQEMADMMKDCCGSERIPFGCCSTMGRMMKFDKGREGNQEHETEKPPKGEQNV
jgi:hypothetical protein